MIYYISVFNRVVKLSLGTTYGTGTFLSPSEFRVTQFAIDNAGNLLHNAWLTRDIRQLMARTVGGNPIALNTHDVAGNIRDAGIFAVNGQIYVVPRRNWLVNNSNIMYRVNITGNSASDVSFTPVIGERDVDNDVIVMEIIRIPGKTIVITASERHWESPFSIITIPENDANSNIVTVHDDSGPIFLGQAFSQIDVNSEGEVIFFIKDGAAIDKLAVINPVTGHGNIRPLYSGSTFIRVEGIGMSNDETIVANAWSALGERFLIHIFQDGSVEIISTRIDESATVTITRLR